MNELIAPNGKLMGVLFDRIFEMEGPPFGGNQVEYNKLFGANFYFIHFMPCYNSYHKRANTELFILLKKK
jgi:hypothetical protein